MQPRNWSATARYTLRSPPTPRRWEQRLASYSEIPAHAALLGLRIGGSNDWSRSATVLLHGITPHVLQEAEGCAHDAFPHFDGDGSRTAGRGEFCRAAALAVLLSMACAGGAYS